MLMADTFGGTSRRPRLRDHCRYARRIYFAKEAAQRLGTARLNHLNKTGELPHFASGGPVDGDTFPLLPADHNQNPGPYHTPRRRRRRGDVFGVAHDMDDYSDRIPLSPLGMEPPLEAPFPIHDHPQMSSSRRRALERVETV